MKKLSICILGIMSVLPAIGANNEFIKSGSLVYEEDNEYFFRYFGSALMTRKGVEDYVGNFEGGKVTHFFMNPNGQRTSYRTKVSEALWDPLKNDKVFPDNPWAQGCRTLFERGLDPYAIWTKKCREIGVSPWISLRVNDQHFANAANKHPFRSRILDFWRDHPELWRTKPGETRNNAWTDHAFDYSKKEVRDYKLALVREFLENWDVDGINIDWMRIPTCLTKGEEREKAHFLTEFMSEVRKIANEFAEKRGHKIGVAVRVPIKLSTSRELGIDADEWAKKGLIDVLIMSQLFQTHFDLRIKEWKDALGEAEKNVAVLAACDHGFSPYECREFGEPPSARRRFMTPPYCNGWAENAYYKGADALYMYNMMYLPDSWYAIIKEGLSRSKVRSSERRHPLTYIDDDLSFEKANCPDEDIQLPKATDEEKTTEFKIQFGHKPSNGKVSVVVGFDKSEGMENSSYTVALNGVEAEKTKSVFRPYLYGKSEFALSFSFPLSATVNGVNTFSIKGTPAKIVWVEMQVE